MTLLIIEFYGIVDKVHLQYWIYDFDAFIADIGGYLGLLLGQSLFGVHQLLIKQSMSCHIKVDF